ncbi:MAG: hypothetical protein AB8G26_01720 [Ilumatobacter sp.]
MTDQPRGNPVAGVGTLAMVELRRWLPKRALLLAVASLPILLLVTFTLGGEADTPFGEVLGVALIGWSIVVVLIVVGTSQGVLADAVEDGTAAWTVSMPVTRKAYVLAKFVGAAPAIALGAVIVPGLVAYPFLAASADAKSDFNAGEVINALGRDSSSYATLPSLGEYAIMLALIALLAVYLLAMMLLFGSRLTSAAALLGLGLASAAVLVVFNGLGIEEGTPGVAFIAVLPDRLEELAVVPALIASAAWSAFAVVLAAWSFDRRPL